MILSFFHFKIIRFFLWNIWMVPGRLGLYFFKFYVHEKGRNVVVRVRDNLFSDDGFCFVTLADVHVLSVHFWPQTVHCHLHFVLNLYAYVLESDFTVRPQVQVFTVTMLKRQLYHKIKFIWFNMVFVGNFRQLHRPKTFQDLTPKSKHDFKNVCMVFIIHEYTIIKSSYLALPSNLASLIFSRIVNNVVTKTRTSEDLLDDQTSTYWITEPRTSEDSKDDQRATVLVARHRMMTMAMALLYHSISPLAALLILPIASSPMPSPSEIIHLVLLRIQPSAIERTLYWR